MQILTKKLNIVSQIRFQSDVLIGLYVGVWAGDGTQYYDKGYCVKICSDKRNKSLNGFIQKIIEDLFGKTSHLIEERMTNQAYVKFYSKFIFEFVYDYVQYEKSKTYSVRLKRGFFSYSRSFLRGYLLGLTLTDGYLKNKFIFCTTSPLLAQNVEGILRKLGFSPSKYIHKRRKYGWKDLYMIRLTKKESLRLETIFNEDLKSLGCTCTLKSLKYEPGKI